MKRSKTDLAESHEVKSLKVICLLEAFSTMDLPERQAIIPELLKLAKIVSGYALNHVSPEFIRFACSGEKKEWTHEEIERGWEMWNFIHRRAAGGCLYFDEHAFGSYVYSITETFEPDSGSRAEFTDNRYCEEKILSRSEFFDIILKEYRINNFGINRRTYIGSSNLAEVMSKEKGYPTYEDLEDPYDGGYVKDIVEDARIAE